MKIISFLLVVFLMMSCAPIKVNYDYDSATNFEKYKTYNYYPNMNTGLSDLDTKRLLDVSESSYNPKGTPDKREALLQAIVEKVLSKYPPKK